MDAAQIRLKDLCYRAYLKALKPTTAKEVLDALQDAYWQGLDMDEDYIAREWAGREEQEPPF